MTLPPPPGGAYSMQPQMYGAQSAMGMYGQPAMQQGYNPMTYAQQAQAQQYMQHQQAVAVPAAAAKDHNDPKAYYSDFWQYAAYYGETAARAYYTTWSPPEGTQPPAGIILPGGAASAQSAAAVSASSSADKKELAPDEQKAATEAWEKYNKEMAEWQEKYGDKTAATTMVVAAIAPTPSPAVAIDESKGQWIQIVHAIPSSYVQYLG